MVERALKKGKGGEVEAGARLGVLLALQLPDPEPVYTELRSVVTILASHWSVSSDTDF